MTEKSRKVLIFTTAYRTMIGGSEIALEEVISRLPDIFFDIVTPRHRRAFLVKECGNNFCVYRMGFGLGEFMDKLLFPCLGSLKAFRLMSKNKYKAIHAYQASFGGMAAFAAKLFFPDKKLIITLQEGKELDKQNFLKRTARNLILKKADIITAISSYLKNYSASVNKKAEIVLIPNGVDLSKFNSYHLPISNGDKKEKTIITISRLVPKNGIGDLIEAFHILNTKYKIQDTKLIIVGDGLLKEKIKLQITNYKLQNNIELVGEMPHEKTPEYLAKAGIFIRPSLSEGLGSAFLEAMASGLAVIGTPVGGIPDFLVDSENGLFCKPGNPEDIAEKILRLLNDDELRKKLSQNGKKLVEEKYNWDKIAEQFDHIYA